MHSMNPDQLLVANTQTVQEHFRWKDKDVRKQPHPSCSWPRSTSRCGSWGNGSPSRQWGHPWSPPSARPSAHWGQSARLGEVCNAKQRHFTVPARLPCCHCHPTIPGCRPPQAAHPSLHVLLEPRDQHAPGPYLCRHDRRSWLRLQAAQQAMDNSEHVGRALERHKP